MIIYAGTTLVLSISTDSTLALCQILFGLWLHAGSLLCFGLQAPFYLLHHTSAPFLCFVYHSNIYKN